MVTIKYESVWRLLNKHDFKLDIENYSELTCIICNNILRNACQSVCGCRYCYQCVHTFLQNDEKFCPGETDECKSQLLNLKGNVQTDHTANKSVSKIKVQCPYELCKCKIELNDMEDHIESHNTCPFSFMGCQKPVKQDVMTDHLQSENYNHIHLLIESFYKMENQMVSMKEDSDMKIASLSKIIEESKVNYNEEISKLNKTIVEQENSNKILNENVIQLTNEITAIKGDVEKTNELVKEVQSIANESKNLIDKTKIDEIFERIFNLESNKKVLELKQEELDGKICSIPDQKIISDLTQCTVLYKNANQKLNNRLSLMREEMRTLIEEAHNENFDKFDDLNPENDNATTDCPPPAKKKRKLKRLKPSAKSSEQTSQSSVKSESSLVTNPTLIGPKVPSTKFRILNFTKVHQNAVNGTETKIYSKQFYTENFYKLQLVVFPNGVDSAKGTYLSLGIHVVKGEYDDKLIWPMEHTVTFSLMDQTTEIVHFMKPSIEIKCMFHKPNPDELDIPIGPKFFIKLSSLFGNAKLFKDDSIVVSCSADVY